MAFQCVMGAVTKCPFGAAPSVLMVLPTHMDLTVCMPAANIMDSIPLLNIMPFGMCNSIMNPMVLAATIAALGALTPMPCIPMTVAPWAPGSATVMLNSMPALNNSSKAMCLWGGAISIEFAGQATVMIA
ncbi:MAG: DUF4280 domain-containing protein [Azospirillaceae bacterium]|nr:DUF4280 domain-containing protein [Azospirillaceae bacterium]